jgi:PucR family transcriptional regulator, purine catabolism regulatory protein
VLTIRSLASNPTLGLQVLGAGAPDALDAPLLWVHNTELLDPSDYLRERELVLTNGLWHVAGNAADFVANVVRAGGAGIVYGLREDSPTTPPELVAACATAGLPLLQLPVEIPFTEMTRAVAAELADRRQAALVETVRRGHDLADAISRGSGPTGVLKVLRRDHHLPLVVVDRTGRVLAEAGTALSDDAGARAGAALRQHPPPLEVELGEQGPAAVFLVAALDHVDAGLLCLRPAGQLSAAEQEALTQAAHYLSLEVARMRLTQAMEARFAGELLEMILAGTEVAAEVYPRLEAFGIDPASPMLVVAAACVGDDGPASAELTSRLSELLPSWGIPALVANSARDVVAIFPWTQSDADGLEIARQMITHVQRQLPATRLVAGVSGPADGARALRRPLREARQACRVLRRRSSGEAVERFSELGTYHLLLGGEDGSSLRRISDTVLLPLREYDARRGGQLEVTLRAFLGNDAQLASTASALYIHVNTLRNRLAKITELTGRDVMTTEGRVDTFLALEADAMVGAAD